MKIKIVVLFVLLLGLILSIWYINSQEVTEGYVAARGENRILVISLNELNLNDSEVSALSDDELDALLDEKMEEFAGNFYDVPFLNHLLGSTYTKGDKVKVYWNGRLYLSMPGQAKGTVFIQKMK